MLLVFFLQNNGDSMRVLIVDDDETSCQLLGKVCKRRGMEAEWTTDSLAGYQMSLRHPYDLFILDVHMPFLSGTAFAEGLKKEHPNVKIILISTFADEALQNTARGLGVALLSKPFTLDRLLTITTEVLGQHA
jgi:DNA-binding response OmpR family regulator